ncbi:hypothetical protein I302_106626 [Kwoniella bestiolae CBS 10118]|uniref:SMP-LTD domain-containing protein n=1 Tax=Kwoniella bestiolae CBS 10118 TaxID=1296100 RepID=A0A1B9G0V9_9TREE|nr:hypothetical protein I302_06112 [Kwoniella bestiolae CBS 10118]OCF24651.1 hypothetical protein I302_06112 [Kwoniella bestiolae CBS 10118]
MWWPFQWLVIYVLGGITFVPLVIVLAIVYVYKYGSVPIGDSDPHKVEKAELQDEQEKNEQIEKSKNSLVGVAEKPMSGWLTVRRQFKPITSGSKNAIVTGSNADSADEAEHEDLEKEKGDTESIITNASSSTAASTSSPNPTTYSARIAQTYRSMVESRAAKKEPVPKEFFFCVLKGSVLFLYEDESQTNCVAALGVDQYTVRIEKEDGKRFKGKDAEMFSKRNAVVLKVAKGVEKKGLPLVSKDTQAGNEEGREREMENKPIFLFTKSNMKMEDWYLALLEASSQAAQAKISDVFESRDMQALVDTIDTEPDPIPMRWFNGMLGRIFFSLYRTEALDQFIITKMMKKLTRVNRPSFLGPIVVREVNVGTSPPFFSKPMLKDLTAEGTAAFEANVQYRSHPSRPNSQVRITIATTATIPTGFKPYVVDLVLAVVVKSLEGNLVLQIKKPPSSRVWYGFTSMPKMDIEIIPVVSERKIQIGMVLKAIEKQLRDVIAESVVLPNMDDLAFFDTSKLNIRGAIFNDSSKIKRTTESEESDTTVPKPEVEIQTSNEDPSSAVPATTNLRKRNIQKSRTVDVNGSGETERAPQLGIPRTDTAPPTISNGTTNKTAATVQATKKWFAQTGSARPPSLTTQTVTGAIQHPSDDNLIRQRSNSSEFQRSSSADPTLNNANFTNSPAIAAVQVSSSTAPLSEEEKKILEAAQPSDNTPSTTPRGELNIRALAGEPRQSDASIGSTSSSSTGANIPSTAPHSSTASLISSLRARDKQALQAQVGTARESLKKWGVGLAAKRKAMKEGVQHREEHRPPALYRPPEEDLREDERSSLATSPNRSLQDRLNAAAHAGVTPVPMPIPARDRSASSSSRPSLFASPSSAASPASASPPKWSPPSSKPTTGVVKDDISQHPSSFTSTPPHTRRPSGSAPVFVQPTSGRSMVVPRVPKRPGQVTGIGHNAAEPMVRKVSTEDGLREELVENVHAEEPKVPPTLPPRRSKESLRPDETPSANPPDIPSPAKPSTPISAVPPPLPPRKPSPVNSGDHTPSQIEPSHQPDTEVSSSNAEPVRPEIQERSNSIAALPSIDTPDPQFNDIPNIDITSPRTTEIESSLSKSPGSASTAENALRSLVAKNEEALKAKGRKSEPSSPNPGVTPIPSSGEDTQEIRKDIEGDNQKENTEIAV